MPYTVKLLINVSCFLLFSLAALTILVIFIGQSIENYLLAFEVSSSQNVAIYVADVNRGLAVKVTLNHLDNTDPIWAKDGRLTFVSGSNTNHDIYTLTLDQLLPINISKTSISDMPIWSPDGRLAFITEQYPHPNRIDIVNQNGTVQSITISIFSDLISIEFPSWLSDNELVFLGGVRNAQKQVFIFNVETNVIQNISNNPNLMHVEPKASPKGDMVAFISYDPNKPLDEQHIWVWEKNSQELQLVTSNNGMNGNFAWSNDGKLAFSSNFSGNFEIYIWNSWTNVISNITNNSWNDINPSWSFDGEIAFISNRSGENNVYIINSETRVIMQRYFIGDSRNPVWSN